MGEWANGLFGCFDNCGLCVFAYFCPCVVFGRVAETVGEKCGLCGFCVLVPIGNIVSWVKIRSKVRELKGIDGNTCSDIVMGMFCGLCSLVQMARCDIDYIVSLPAEELAFEGTCPYDLWTMHKTHPSEMDGETTLKQHDNVHRQISAFEKLLQHAMNKFSREKLYGMLKILTKDYSREYTPGEHVYSMAHLKRMVIEIETPGESRTLSKETEKHVIKYFRTFFEDVEYLKELKKYFDEKVYICLYEYYYDPLDDIQESELEVLLQRKGVDEDEKNLNSQDDQSETSSRKVMFENDVTEVYTGDRKEEEIVFDFLSDKGKLSHAVRQMFKVNEKWANILNESDPHMEAYDPDSKYELVVFPDYVKYEAVLRLVPDVFVKAYKSVELAKLWWTQANKMYPNTPRTRRTVKDLHLQEGELSKQIVRVSEDIERIEHAVLSRESELEQLVKRESRFHVLSDQCEKLEDKKDDVTQSYHSIMGEVTHMKEELKVLEKGTKKYTELENRVREKDKRLMLTEDELKLLAYQFKIVQEDFSVELELRPHLIRFKADIEEKITDLKHGINEKVDEKRKTEKILVLLKTNCDRMKQIMQKLNLTSEVDDEESFIDESGVRNEKSEVGSVKGKSQKDSGNKQKSSLVPESKSSGNSNPKAGQQKPKSSLPQKSGVIQTQRPPLDTKLRSSSNNKTNSKLTSSSTNRINNRQVVK